MKHVGAVSELASIAVNKAGFWSSLCEGQLLFVSGNEEISHAIEDATRSPWSHIATIVKYYYSWAVQEAVWPHGVTITPLWHYIDSGLGLVLAKRVNPATGEDIAMLPSILAGFQLLGRDYAALGLVKEGLHRIFPGLPPEMNDKDCYCSGDVALCSIPTPVPYPMTNGAPSPEDIWAHDSTQAVCALLEASK